MPVGVYVCQCVWGWVKCVLWHVYVEGMYLYPYTHSQYTPIHTNTHQYTPIHTNTHPYTHSQYTHTHHTTYPQVVHQHQVHPNTIAAHHIVPLYPHHPHTHEGPPEGVRAGLVHLVLTVVPLLVVVWVLVVLLVLVVLVLLLVEQVVVEQVVVEQVVVEQVAVLDHQFSWCRFPFLASLYCCHGHHRVGQHGQHGQRMVDYQLHNHARLCRGETL